MTRLLLICADPDFNRKLDDYLGGSAWREEFSLIEGAEAGLTDDPSAAAWSFNPRRRVESFGAAADAGGGERMIRIVYTGNGLAQVYKFENRNLYNRAARPGDFIAKQEEGDAESEDDGINSTGDQPRLLGVSNPEQLESETATLFEMWEKYLKFDLTLPLRFSRLGKVGDYFCDGWHLVKARDGSGTGGASVAKIKFRAVVSGEDKEGDGTRGNPETFEYITSYFNGDFAAVLPEQIKPDPQPDKTGQFSLF